MSPQPAPDKAHIIGRALMTSGLVFVVFAALIYTGVVPIDPDVRLVVAAGVGTVAVLDLLIGFWFLSRSR